MKLRKTTAAVSAVIAVLAASLLSGCQTPSAATENQVPDAEKTNASAEPPPKEIIDGQAAWNYVKYQVELGPRPAGSAASKTLAQDLKTRLGALGYKAELQHFAAETPDGPLEMCNVTAEHPGHLPQIIAVGAHYDTKLFRECSFVGANDGGSGVAVALELAKALAKIPLRHTVKFIFFDGEEAVRHWSAQDSLYGSRHFAAQLSKNKTASSVKAVVVLDMVGDKDLKISEEYFSTPELREKLRQSARELNLQQYLPANRLTAIEDDHLPFLDLKIPALDVIGFYTSAEGVYPEYWHTPEDTLDKISPQSLSAAGSIVLRALRKIDAETE